MILTPPRPADPRSGKRRTFEMTPKRERCIWMDPREASDGKPRMKTECAGYGRRPPPGRRANPVSRRGGMAGKEDQGRRYG